MDGWVGGWMDGWMDGWWVARLIEWWLYSEVGLANDTLC